MAHVDVAKVAEKVLERFARPRVGLLWTPDSLPGTWSAPASATWVHYLTKGCEAENLRPHYRLPLLDRPEDEARTLSMLVVFRCCPYLLAELARGVPASPQGRFVAGCLGNALPVLADVSHLTAWKAWRGTPYGEWVFESLRALSILGVVMIGMDPDEGMSVPSTPERRAPSVLHLDGPGWFTWRELVGRVERCGAVVLGQGARLTPEARERLAALGIDVR